MRMHIEKWSKYQNIYGVVCDYNFSNFEKPHIGVLNLTKSYFYDFKIIWLL